MYVMYVYVYVYRWLPTLREELPTGTEPKNLHDKHTVKILKDNEVVGHLPRDISKNYTR